MSLTILIITLVVGLILLTLEIVALPGFVAGLCGTLITCFSIWQIYATHGSMAGSIALVASIVICVALLVLFMKKRTWQKFSLDEKVDSKVNEIDNRSVSIGSRGTTIARLAPTGKASFGGELMEVHAINSFIDPDRTVEVVAIDGYRIDVREVAE